MIRLLIWLRLGRLLPRCSAEPPWRLTDEAGICIRPAKHERWDNSDGANWHADETCYIWNDVIGKWRWQGPPVKVEGETS